MRLLVFVAALFAGPAQAQPVYSFKHLNIDDGLSQNFVESILQDHMGFMWFGTRDGLNRYDGYSFTIYRNRPGDTTSLLSNKIGSLLEDDQNRLWAIAAGLHLYDRDQDVFLRVISGQIQLSSMKKGEQGCLWLFGPSGEFFRLFPPEHPRPPAGARPMPGGFRLAGPYALDQSVDLLLEESLASLELTDRYLWLSTNRRVFRLPRLADGSWPAPSDACFEPAPRFPQADSLYLSLLFNDSQGRLWLQTQKGLMRWQPETDQWQRFPLPGKWFTSSWEGAASHSVEDSQGRFWLATFDGILVFDPQDASYQFLREDSRRDDGLSLNNTRCVYKDRSGNIWVGTAGMGIDLHLAYAKPFVRYLGRKKTGRQTSVYQMQVDHMGRLWYANNVYDLERLDLRSGQVSRDELPASLHGVFNDFVQTTDGAMWLYKGTHLLRWDIRSDQYRQRQLFIPRSREIPDRLRSQLHPDGTDVWVCSAAELRRYDARLELQESHDLPPLGLSNVNELLRTPDGTFWIGFTGGLLKMNVQTGQWTFFEAEPGSRQALQNRNVLCLLPDPDQPERYLWIGTGGGGLHRLDILADTFTFLTTRHGLANDFIYGILPDAEGRLWLSSNRGLSRLEPQNGQILNYTVKDGLQSNEFNRWAFCKAPDGRLFFGGINGITAFYPEAIASNPLPPPVVLTGMQIDHREVSPDVPGSPLSRSLSETRSIELTSEQNDLAFRFAALDYTQPEQNRYRYKLEGYDEDWVDIGTARKAVYTNLPPGSYTFRVQGSNSDGVWNVDGTAVRLEIDPPLWRSGWAFGGYTIAGGFLLWGWYLFQNHRRRLRDELRMEKLESQKLSELDTFKSRFFASISHEFRTPITLIQGQVDQLMKDGMPRSLKRKLESIRSESDNLLSLVNQLLDIARLESGKLVLRRAKVSLAAEAARLVASFDSFADMRGIALSFRSSLTREYCISADPDSLQKILQNLLTNALKFTPPGGAVQVLLDRDARNNELALQVRDTGPGISSEALPRVFERFFQEEKQLNQAEPGLGIGLALVRELVEAQGARIAVASEPGRGATFTLYWPIAAVQQTGSTAAAPAARDPGTLSGLSRRAGKEGEAGERPMVLIAEDHDGLRAYLRECLKEAFRLLEAADGTSALSLCQTHIPDLVISDVIMPGADGFELVRQLKRDRRTSHVPVILLTARVEDADRLKGLQLGADDYLTKPFRPEQLLARIRNLIHIRQQLRAKYSRALLHDPGSLAEDTLDQKFLSTVHQVIADKLDDENFGVEVLAKAVNLSSSQLYRKLKALTGKTTVQLIQSLRLERAAHLLRQGYTVSEVAHKIGFRSPAYFSQLFRKEFGSTPQEYSKENGDIFS